MKKTQNAVASWALAGGIVLALSGCSGGRDAPAPQAAVFQPATMTAQACASLATFAIAAKDIALPTTGASILSATFMTTADAGNQNGNFCKLLGVTYPVDPAAPVINFAINLPAQWNGKLVQIGSGGFGGTLITGLDPLNFTPAGSPTPLAQGYITIGDDSGHVGTATQGAFAANDEALANYGRLNLRKTHSVAMALVARVYGVERPLKTYFIGSSTGGRDALSVAQNWPEEYDGIFINRPALNYTGLRLSNIQLGRSLFLNDGAGWINPVKTRLLLDRVMASCDTLDGLQDGIISNVEACKARAAATLAGLRCANGADTGDTCLSDPQIATVTAMSSPLVLRFPLANGVTTYGGYNLMAGMVFGPPYATARNFGPTRSAPPAPNYLATLGATGNAPNAYVTGDQWMKYFITRNASFNTLSVDPVNPGTWQQRIADVSALTDAASTNLDRFFQRGGRIVWTHGAADEVVSTDSSIDYYKQLVAKYGQAAIDSSVRFYLVFGHGHGDTGAFIPAFDSLRILSSWIEAGTDPANTIVAANIQAKAPADTSPAGTRARPLCRYPAWPRYSGSGDPNLAASFACVAQ